MRIPLARQASGLGSGSFLFGEQLFFLKQLRANWANARSF